MMTSFSLGETSYLWPPTSGTINKWDEIFLHIPSYRNLFQAETHQYLFFDCISSQHYDNLCIARPSVRNTAGRWNYPWPGRTTESSASTSPSLPWPGGFTTRRRTRRWTSGSTSTPRDWRISNIKHSHLSSRRSRYPPPPPTEILILLFFSSFLFSYCASCSSNCPKFIIFAFYFM